MSKNVTDTEKIEICRKSNVSKNLNATKVLCFCDKIHLQYYPQKSINLFVLEQREFEKLEN
jgi:hypothetical protein